METQDDVNQHEQAQEEDESEVMVNWVTSYAEVVGKGQGSLRPIFPKF